jgi:hypothetical protein
LRRFREVTVKKGTSSIAAATFETVTLTLSEICVLPQAGVTRTTRK